MRGGDRTYLQDSGWGAGCHAGDRTILCRSPLRRAGLADAFCRQATGRAAVHAGSDLSAFAVFVAGWPWSPFAFPGACWLLALIASAVVCSLSLAPEARLTAKRSRLVLIGLCMVGISAPRTARLKVVVKPHAIGIGEAVPHTVVLEKRSHVVKLPAGEGVEVPVQPQGKVGEVVAVDVLVVENDV